LSIKNHIVSLSNYVQKRNFGGYDPYDALNSPLVRNMTFGKKYGRIAWIQLLRRIPLNLRPFLFVPKGSNPKGLGLFLGGYAKLYKTEARSEYLGQIHQLIGLLEGCRSIGYSGNCWGYNFDWQNRAFFIPKFTPTIVNSAFIGHALLDAYETTGIQSALNLAVPIKEFLLKDLHRSREGETFCFSYTPLDQTAVHNANLLGASLLIRLYSLTGEMALRDAALASLAYTMKYQRDDGSWFYAETGMQSWIDSFHTGFNLEAIRWFLRLREALECQEAYRKGVQFYAENYFLPDGTTKYYYNRIWPIDIHAPAEAVSFFSGEGEKYRELVESVLGWTLTHLYNQRGFFYFRKGRWLTNKVSYMRWSQAWMFRALTDYYSYYQRGEFENLD
jgi:rhamnogalacturonyl hydrolase YesR